MKTLRELGSFMTVFFVGLIAVFVMLAFFFPLAYTTQRNFEDWLDANYRTKPSAAGCR